MGRSTYGGRVRGLIETGEGGLEMHGYRMGKWGKDHRCQGIVREKSAQWPPVSGVRVENCESGRETDRQAEGDREKSISSLSTDCAAGWTEMC